MYIIVAVYSIHFSVTFLRVACISYSMSFPVAQEIQIHAPRHENSILSTRQNIDLTVICWNQNVF